MTTVIVRCPGCGRTYRPTLELVKAGARARCAKCHTSFEMVPEPEPAPLIEELVVPAGNGHTVQVPSPNDAPTHSGERMAVPPPPRRAEPAIPSGPPWPWAELCEPDLGALPARPGPAAAALLALLDDAPETLAVPAPEGSDG